MKNYKLPFLGFALVLLITSCRKEDVRQTNEAESVTSGTVTKAQWNSFSTWENLKSENGSTYFSKVSDSSITNEVMNGGLVLVYKKSGSDIQSLPFQEKESKTYWYYQASKGSIRTNRHNNPG